MDSLGLLFRWLFSVRPPGTSTGQTQWGGYAPKMLPKVAHLPDHIQRARRLCWGTHTHPKMCFLKEVQAMCTEVGTCLLWSFSLHCPADVEFPACVQSQMLEVSSQDSFRGLLSGKTGSSLLPWYPVSQEVSGQKCCELELLGAKDVRTNAPKQYHKELFGAEGFSPP